MSALTHDDLLTQAPEQLLAAFVERFNDLTASHDEQHTLIALQRQQLEENRQSLAFLQQQLDEQQENSQALESELEKCRALETKADKIAANAIAVGRERDKLRTQVAELQKQLTQMKGGDNPQRLRDQLKRVKLKSEDKDKKIKRLEGDGKDYRRELKNQQLKLNEAVNKVRELKQQLAHDTGSGLYHNGEHHLIIWPQKTTMEREDGTRFQSRALLYLHQSGRGGLFSFNEADGARLCAAPKGGLRPSKECSSFAAEWLYKVNMLQDGDVQPEDMIPVNYNPELEQAA